MGAAPVSAASGPLLGFVLFFPVTSWWHSLQTYRAIREEIQEMELKAPLMRDNTQAEESKQL